MAFLRARPRGSVAALSAAALTLTMDVVYLLLLRAQGEGDLGSPRAWLIATLLASAALAAVAAVFLASARVRFVLLSSAAFTLLTWGFLGMFTIGLPVFVGGVLALLAADAGSDQLGTTAAFGLAVLTAAAAVGVAAAVLATTS